MSAQPTAQNTGVSPASVAPAVAGHGRTVVVASALALGAAAAAAVLLWHPGPARDDFSYPTMHPVRGATWTAALIDATGYGIAAVALGVAVCLLAPIRGARWATVGAVLTAVGGILFAIGDFAYGVVGWYATSDAIPVDSDTKLMAYAKDNPAHMVAPQILGFLALNIGVLLLAVALWRSRSTPRWLPIATVVLTIGQFAGLPNRALDVEQAALLAAFIAVAWFLGRAGSRTR